MKKIYLSAGHTGKGTGTSSPYGDEGIEALRLREAVTQRIVGQTVYNDPDKLSLTGVIKDVNKKCGYSGVAIELHFNSAGVVATGTETVVANEASQQSQKYANDLAAIVSKALGIVNRGMKTESQSHRGTLGFLNKTKCPAVLIEVCFINNESDMKAYRKNYETLVRSLSEYLSNI